MGRRVRSEKETGFFRESATFRYKTLASEVSNMKEHQDEIKKEITGTRPCLQAFHQLPQLPSSLSSQMLYDPRRNHYVVVYYCPETVRREST